MHAHQPARLTDPALSREREQLQAIAEQHVILRHAARSLRLAVKGA